MQSYSCQRQVWVPVCRCCPSSLTGLGFTRWARLAGGDSEATFPALGFPVSLCGSWGLPRVLVPAWPAIAPASHCPPLLNCIECHYASQAGLEYPCSQADLDQQWSSCISFQVVRLQVLTHTPRIHSFQIFLALCSKREWILRELTDFFKKLFLKKIV